MHYTRAYRSSDKKMEKAREASRRYAARKRAEQGGPAASTSPSRRKRTPRPNSGGAPPLSAHPRRAAATPPGSARSGRPAASTSPSRRKRTPRPNSGGAPPLSAPSVDRDGVEAEWQRRGAARLDPGDEAHLPPVFQIVGERRARPDRLGDPGARLDPDRGPAELAELGERRLQPAQSVLGLDRGLALVDGVQEPSDLRPAQPRVIWLSLPLFWRNSAAAGRVPALDLGSTHSPGYFAWGSSPSRIDRSTSASYSSSRRWCSRRSASTPARLPACLASAAASLPASFSNARQCGCPETTGWRFSLMTGPHPSCRRGGCAGRSRRAAGAPVHLVAGAPPALAGDSLAPLERRQFGLGLVVDAVGHCFSSGWVGLGRCVSLRCAVTGGRRGGGRGLRAGPRSGLPEGHRVPDPPRCALGALAVGQQGGAARHGLLEAGAGQPGLHQERPELDEGGRLQAQLAARVADRSQELDLQLRGRPDLAVRRERSWSSSQADTRRALASSLA